MCESNIMFVKRKCFEKTFLEFSVKNNKEIWAISSVRKLHKDIIDIAVRLVNLEFIKYVKISNETIIASSEVKGTKIKKPITTMDHPTATGIEIIYHIDYKILNFYEINSTIKGNGSKMIAAVLTNFPTKDWRFFVTFDWSGGFWKKMKEKYNDRNWIIS